jgi:hypothetical protein
MMLHNYNQKQKNEIEIVVEKKINYVANFFMYHKIQ